QRILYEICSGIYCLDKRLPPELEIARYLGVSRTVIRDCLSILEREGFISRKQGVGTIINRHVIHVETRMDLEQEFLDMIESTGRQAAIAFTQSEELPADAQMAEQLHVRLGDPILVVRRLITADGVSAIYCIDHIAGQLVAETDYDKSELNAPIFYFLDKRCHEEVYMDLTEVRAIGAEGEVAHALAVPPGSPLLYMDEVGYNFKGDPVLYSREYYRDGILKHTVLRKKI
ncbi:MAG: GntR family transcriptional regulator, partial [Oscillospiraceae bacterium]